VSDLTQFDRQSAARIARVVRAVEGEQPKARPLSFESFQQGQRKTFRIGSFSGAWSKDATKTVTLRDTTATVAVVNLFAAVPASGSCAIARDGTAWYLVAAECGTVV
jgi:hypothetical protein